VKKHSGDTSDRHPWTLASQILSRMHYVKKFQELGNGCGVEVNVTVDEVAIKPYENYMKYVD
jgi:hypothetical protein